jgi:hypothetical protein
MRRTLGITGTAVAALALAIAVPRWTAAEDQHADLLKVREAVWRAWFANDRKTLETLVPPDTITVSSGEKNFQHQADVFRSAAEFQASGGKLLRLEFPHTEIQDYGNVAITYSLYLYETEVAGKRSRTSGRATEIFVRRHGHWTNPGWHTDSEK